MTILFGTVEYFQNEILNFLKKNRSSKVSEERILDIYSTLENEILNEFVCAENVQNECLQNLRIANKNLMGEDLVFMRKEVSCK